MEAKQEVVVQNSGKALAANPPQAFDFNPEDVVLPRLLLMQGMSGIVGDGNAVMGDIVSSLTGEKLGDKNSPVGILPLTMFKTCVTILKEGGNFVESRPMGNFEKLAQLEGVYQGVREKFKGQAVRYYQQLNFYVLTAKSIEDGMVLPALIGFRSTSLNAGKKLNSHFLWAAMNRAKPFSKVLSLSCSLQKNADGKPYYTFDIGKSVSATAAQIEQGEVWASMLASNASTIKVDEEDKTAETVLPEGGQERF
jgi:hypothetical protein